MIHSEIIDKKIETPTVTTISFKWNEKVEPGQFVMVWVPKVSEIPMSLSKIDGIKSITVKKYGTASSLVAGMNIGDRLYLRGPYGRPFTKYDGKTLLIGGGSGMASLRPLIKSTSFGVVSARTSNELLFADHFEKDKLLKVTDDGSEGIKGVAVDALGELDLESFDMIYVCGPERMLKSIFDFLKGKRVHAQFSLERMMKCGIGVCDSCSIDGYQLCKDGPAFDMEVVSEMNEFGKTKLTESGVRVWF